MQDYKQLTAAYEQFRKNNQVSGNPANLYDPINYLMDIGGKRIRPVLSLLACQLFKQPDTPAFWVAHSLEVFHNFTLMHDDIMDEAPLRRGMPTVHHKWNQSTAILSGDLMLIKAYDYLMNAGQTALIPLFNQTAAWVCEGQQMDMNFEQRDAVSEAEYTEMIRLKTAVLLGTSLQLGALAAGAAPTTAEALFRYGQNHGIAFQLMDDYLDVFAAATSGKQAGGDIYANKKTMLYLKALQLSTPQQRETLLKWYATKEETALKIEEVTAIFKESGAAEAVTQMASAYHQKANTELDLLKQQGCVTTPLEELTTLLENRVS